MVIGDKLLTDLTFIDVLLVIIVGWVLVALWSRVVDNITFNYLKLNKDSVYHTLLIAIVTTAIFLVFVFSFDNAMGNIVEQEISGGGIIPPTTPQIS